MGKKVLLTITHLTGGGAERVVSVWANELSDKGYDVSLLLAGRTENEYYLSENVTVYTVCEKYDDYKKISFLNKVLQRRKLLKVIKPDYLISFLPHTQVLSMFSAFGLRIKRIETVRINPWVAANSRGKLFAALWKLCFKTSYKTILQTLGQAPYFSKSIIKKSLVIPNPVSEVYIKEYKENISDNIQRFIAAGRIAPQKNYTMMISGFAKALKKHADDPKYKNIYLDIYGAEDGANRENIKEFIKSLDMESRIFLRERTNRLQDEYKESDVFLMTSDFEGLPNSLIEAMASKLICISTNCKTGPEDLIDDGVCGFLIPTGDADALCDAIEKVMEMSKEEREKIAGLARQKILTLCSKENSINSLCKILK